MMLLNGVTENKPFLMPQKGLNENRAFDDFLILFCRYSPLVRILLHYGCDPTAEDDTGTVFIF